MKIFPQSLRWRLQIWYGLLLLMVLCAFGFTAHHLEKVERLRNVDNDLQQHLAMVVNELRASPQRNDPRPDTGSPNRPPSPPPRPQEPGGPPGPNTKFDPKVDAMFTKASQYYYVVWMRDKEPITRSANAPREVPKPERNAVSTRERSGHLREKFLLAAPVDCVLVGRSMEAEESALFFNATLLMAVGCGLFVISLVGGGWLIAQAIKPIENITATAARIADGELSQRIEEGNTKSELGQLSIALNQTFARLEDAFAQQQRFTADAAHELRTPLTVLLLQVQTTLARERTVEDYRDTLQSCERAGERMKKLLESLLQLARLDAREEPLQQKSFDAAKIAGECLELVRPLALEKGIVLNSELTPTTVNGDADRIAQVITNLLTNALQHTPKDGIITLRVKRDGESTIIEVSDSGQGISWKDLPHIFERFYRADKARTSTAGRTGLGLSIAKAIVEAHGGTITAKSEQGQGSTFLIRLPHGFGGDSAS
jgi:heavy metal sensor kinase